MPEAGRSPGPIGVREGASTISIEGSVQMKRFKILVAVDESQASEAAVTVAGLIADALKARVGVVRVNHPGLPDGDRPTPEAAARKTLATLGVKAEIQVRGGDPVDDIPSAARGFDCDLLVMGSRGRSNVSGLVLGSVSQEVVARAACPVLLVRARKDSFLRPRSILLALEGEEGAEPLVAITAKLAKAFDATVTIAHVSFPGGEELERSLYHARFTHGEEAAAAAVARLRKLGISAISMPLASHLGVPRAIARYAEEIDAGLVVMGSHGAPEEAARGGLAIGVSHLTTRPVLVTREHEASD
jgi:nucleotide-binding universal stress UspA family protein